MFITGDENGFTTDELVAQCYVFFLAGFETSSTTVTFTLFELAQHPEIQEKVREELFTVLQKHNNELSYDALKDLVYMQQVIDGKQLLIWFVSKCYKILCCFL